MERKSATGHSAWKLGHGRGDGGFRVTVGWSSLRGTVKNAIRLHYGTYCLYFFVYISRSSKSYSDSVMTLYSLIIVSSLFAGVCVGRRRCTDHSNRSLEVTLVEEGNVSHEVGVDCDHVCNGC